jgi:hypothetical protein
MRRLSRRVYLPAGVLRRFRLPEPEAELTGRAAPRTRFQKELRLSLWVALFALFTSLLYWLGAAETWQVVLDQKPAAAAPAAPGTESPNPEKPIRLAPALSESPLAGSPPAASPAGVSTPPPETTAASRPKPALVLDGHRLRPIVEWRDDRSERPPMIHSD